MTWLSLGSLALPMTLNRHGVQTRAQLAHLGHEVTTGRAQDPAKHLRGDLGHLTQLEARDLRLQAQKQSLQGLATHADRAQTSIGHIASLAQSLGDTLLSASLAGPGTPAIASAAQASRTTLEDMVATINQRHDGRALFAGAAIDRKPLLDMPTILSTLAPAVAGGTSARDIADRVVQALTGAGDLFETTLWAGSAPAEGPYIGDGQHAVPLPTALDPGVRTALAGAIIGALSGDETLGLGQDQRAVLARIGAETLMGNASSMARLQSEIGSLQNQLQTRQDTIQAERDGLELARQTLIGVDPYDAAAKLQATQVQLEMVYTLTARTSRLALSEYLR